MNTIQITEESAIIPLAKLNEYKELEMLINGILSNKEKFVVVTNIYDNGLHRQYLASPEWEIKNAVHDSIRIHKNYVDLLKKKVSDLEDELRKTQKDNAILYKQARSKLWNFFK